MNIALDYDGTVTHDVGAWLKFVELFQKRGHQIFVVTMRTPSEGANMDPRLLEMVDNVVYTSREGKRQVVAERGIRIDVWIDDNPEAVLLHAEQVWSYCTPEGVTLDPSQPGVNEKLVRIDVAHCVQAHLATSPEHSLVYKPIIN